MEDYKKMNLFIYNIENKNQDIDECKCEMIEMDTEVYTCIKCGNTEYGYVNEYNIHERASNNKHCNTRKKYIISILRRIKVRDELINKVIMLYWKILKNSSKKINQVYYVLKLILKHLDIEEYKKLRDIKSNKKRKELKLIVNDFLR